MSDGNALLLALVRRKGSPHALADWILERVPEVVPPEGVLLLQHIRGTLYAHVYWVYLDGNAAWLSLRLECGVDRRVCRMDAHIDLSSPDAGHWLAKHLNQTFIRRKPRKKTAA